MDSNQLTRLDRTKGKAIGVTFVQTHASIGTTSLIYALVKLLKDNGYDPEGTLLEVQSEVGDFDLNKTLGLELHALVDHLNKEQVHIKIRDGVKPCVVPEK